MNRKLATVTTAVVLLGGGAAAVGLSVAGAQTGSTSPATTAAPATTGVPRPTRADRLKAVLDPLVADKTISADQEQKVIAALEAAGPKGPAVPGGRPGGTGGRGRQAMQAGLDAAASTIGITPEALFGELRSGATIAKVAADHHVDVAKVIAALVKERTDAITAQVAAGHLTQAEADARISQLTDRMTKVVNGAARPAFGPGRGFGPGHHDGEGSGAPGGPGGSETPPTTAAGS